MKTLSLSCNSCGGGLTPPEDARYVTCSFCGTRLQVCHEGNTYFSRVMEAIAQDTAKMSGDLDVIKIQNEIERLDREWGVERERYLVHNTDGSKSEPGGWAGSFVFIALWIIVVLAVTAILSKSQVGSVIALLPIGVTVVGILGIISNVKKGEEYQIVLLAYQRKRATLLEKLPKDFATK